MAVKFMKIDLLKVRRFLWMLFIPFIALAFLLGEKSYITVLFAIGYGMFIGLVFCEFPFNNEREQESGFLKMLPSRNGDDIRGHFLFGLIILPLFFAIGFLVAGIARLIRPDIAVFTWNGQNIGGIYWILLGISFVMAGVEYLLFTVFRYSSVQTAQILRIVPALLFFFLMMNASGKIEEVTDFDFGLLSGPFPVLCFAGCLAVYFLMAVISVRISNK